jgi:hypothetical protein
MKSFLFSLITLVVFSCGSKQEKTESPDLALPPPPLPDSIASVFPAWVKNMYEKADSNRDWILSKEVLFFRQLNENVSYCLYVENTGTGSTTYIATQRNQQHLKDTVIGDGGQTDFSALHYDYSEYKFDTAKNQVVFTKVFEDADPKYVDKNGNFKAGYNRENAVFIDSVVLRLNITPTGYFLIDTIRKSKSI